MGKFGGIGMTIRILDAFGSIISVSYYGNDPMTVNWIGSTHT